MHPVRQAKALKSSHSSFDMTKFLPRYFVYEQRHWETNLRSQQNLGRSVWRREQPSGIGVYQARGILTASALPRVCAELAVAIRADARACLINLSRAVWLLPDQGLADALASIESTYSRLLGGAWVVQEANANAFRRASMHLAQQGIARRVFTDYEQALAWVESEALLPRW